MDRKFQQIMRYAAGILAVIIPLAVTSCHKDDIAPEAQRRTVSFSAGVATKAGDDGIGTLDALVFRENGQREAYARSGGNSVQVSLPTGIPLRWYLVANATASLGSLLTESDLLSSRALLDGQTPSSVTMYGRGSGTIGDGTSTVGVELSRTVSRITLGSISPVFLKDSYQASAVKLSGIHVINAAGSCPYTLIPYAGGVWHNRLGREPGLGQGLSAMLGRDMDMTLDGHTVEGPWTFYACPNPTDNGIDSRTAPSWSERNTRLVVEISIDGVPNYYPMTLPAMECNTEYLIREAILKGPGSASPDIPVERHDMAFTVSVRPWEQIQTDAEFR